MSWYAIAWSESAPVGDAYERAVVSQMARRAKKDGSDAALSIASMARYAVASERTIARVIARLEERGVIAEGDQAVVAYIDPRYRPKVWNLQIPYSYFSADMLEEVNQERRELGRPPLTAEERPPLAAPTPTRAPRADVGTKKPRKTAEQSTESVDDLPEQDPDPEGCLVVTPQGGLVVTPETGPGVTTSQAQGGLVVTGRGDYKSPEKTLVNEKRDEEKRGGTTEVRAERASASPDPHPPPSPPRADWTDPSTWFCSDHLAVVQADPGADIPGCGRCARVHEWGEKKQAEAAAADERAADECRWHDELTGMVIDPATGLPFVDPAWRCDHRTPPERVAELVAAKRAERERSLAPGESGPGKRAAKASLRARGRRPTASRRPRTEWARGDEEARRAAREQLKAARQPPVPSDTNGQEEQPAPVVDHQVAV